MATWMGEIGAFARVVSEDSAEVPRECGDADVVLVDGSGDVPRDAALVERMLATRALRRAHRTRIGVLAGDASAERLREDARALGEAGADCIVVTRLDLARTPAAAFEAACASRLPVAFASTGIDEADRLFRCGPERVADVFLKGRIQ
jgi:flagellar biosynthesis GTPase FlhF